MIHYTNLKKEQFLEWVSLCTNCFSKDEEQKSRMKAYFIRHFMNDENRDYQDIFIAMDNQKIIGSIRVFKRKMFLNGVEIDFLGIGEVCTDSLYRNQGIIKNIFQNIFSTYTKGFAFYMLSTGIFHFYEQFGFQRIPYPLKEIEVTKEVSKDVFEISNTNPMLHSIYQKKQKNGNIIRSDFYFQHWVKDELPQFCSVFEDEYLSISQQENEVVLYEYLGEKYFDRLISSSILTTKATILIPQYIKTNFPVLNCIEGGHRMIKMIEPFHLPGKTISNQEELIQYLKNTSAYTFKTDNY